MRPLSNRGVSRRVEVFGLAVAHDAAAEGDDAAAPVGDREHDPAAEEVEAVAAILGPDEQPGLQQQVFLEALLEQGGFQRRAAVRREAEPEAARSSRRRGRGCADRPARRCPPARAAAPRTRRTPPRRRRAAYSRPRPAPARPGSAAAFRRPGLAGQALDRLGERQVVDAHREADDVAMRAAAEAVEEALVVVDGEGRRLLVMERAQAGMLAALADQAHAPADHFGTGEARAKLVKEAWGKGQVCTLSTAEGSGCKPVNIRPIRDSAERLTSLNHARFPGGENLKSGDKPRQD